jgi:hypothetical protein
MGFRPRLELLACSVPRPSVHRWPAACAGPTCPTSRAFNCFPQRCSTDPSRGGELRQSEELDHGVTDDGRDGRHGIRPGLVVAGADLYCETGCCERLVFDEGIRRGGVPVACDV